jgi:hypothetical protein
VIAAIEGTFVAFHRRLRDMQAVTTCPCSACANIGMLKLKFVVHHGKFSRQRLGTVEQLHGTDVIVAHRLLKNSVPSKEYLLVTEAVLERLPAERCELFTPHSESFDLRRDLRRLPGDRAPLGGGAGEGTPARDARRSAGQLRGHRRSANRARRLADARA